MPDLRLSSTAALGYRPLVAIQIALAGGSADTIEKHRAKSAAREA